LYFSVHPNGEREVVTVMLRPRPHLKRLRFDIDLGDLLIKGRQSAGNRVTKEIVQKITQKEVGGSTLAARKVWYDDVVGRLNDEGRGKFHFDEDMIHIEKWVPERPISAVYYDGDKELHYVKRFTCEITSDKRVSYISEAEGSYLDCVSTAKEPVVRIVYNKLLKETKNLPDNEVALAPFIDVKGMKAQGNQLTKLKVKEIVLTHPIEGNEPWPEEIPLEITNSGEDGDDAEDSGTTIEWDLTKPDDDDQPTLF
jgi:topoisomerase-4 subunit A